MHILDTQKITQEERRYKEDGGRGSAGAQSKMIGKKDYDEFNRLSSASKTNSSGTVLTQLGWDYDRYGNRWHQNLVAGTGTTSLASFLP